MATTGYNSSRRRPRTPIILGGFLVVIGGLVAAGPRLVSLGVGGGLIRYLLERRVDAEVSFDRIQLRWFGSQAIDGLTLTDQMGAEIARLDLWLDAGLLGLATGRSRTLGIDVSGVLRGEIRPDGTLSFADLFVRSHRARRGRGGVSKAREPFSLAGVPATSVRLGGVRLELHDLVTGQMIRLGGISGELAYTPGGRVLVELSSPTTTSAGDGSLSLTATITGLFDRAGRMTLDRGSGQISLEASNVVVPLSRRKMVVDSLKFSARSEDLMQRLVVTGEVDARVEAPDMKGATEMGRLEGTVVFERPVAPGGQVDVSLERVTGRLVGRRVPMALFQPALAATDIILTRDIGDTVDVDARFSTGARREIVITATSEHVELDLAATFDPASGLLRGDRLHLAVAIAPELLVSRVGIAIDRRAGFVLDLDAFSLGSERIETSARGTITLEGSIALVSGPTDAPTLPEPLSVAGLRVAFDTSGVGERVTAKGSVTIDGATTSFDVVLRDLLDQEGSLALGNLTPTGTVHMSGVGPETLARLWPARADLVTAAILGPLDVTVRWRPEADDLLTEVSATGGGLDLDVAILRRDGMLSIAHGRGTLVVTPRLAQVLQRDEPDPILLWEPTVISVTLEPGEVAAWPPGTGETEEFVIAAHLRAEPMVLGNVPGLAGTLVVRGLAADIAAPIGDLRSVSSKGELSVSGNRSNPAAGTIRFELAASGGRVSDLFVEGRDLSTKGLAPLLGADPEVLAGWLGNEGSATVAIESDAPGAGHATISAEFPHLEGDFEVTFDRKTLSVEAHRTRITLSREAIQRRLGGGVEVVQDVPFQLTVNRLRFPWAMMAGRSFHSKKAQIDVALRGGPLLLRTNGGTQKVDHLQLTIRCDDLARGVQLRLNGNVPAAGGRKKGQLNVQAALNGLVTDRVLSLANAELQMSATARRVPTAFVDALANLRGMLVAAVGPWIDVRASADRLSLTGGSIEARMNSSNSWFTLRAQGRQDALWITPENPLVAELALTQPLKERLLYKIHPILADIRSTDQPLRVTVTAATIPLDGDVSRLDANIRITVGRVALDSGSAALGLLMLANATNAATIPAEIEPIVATIRKGIVRYERFAVRLDKYTLLYSGHVDLNTQTVNLRTDVPLEALALSIRELRGYTDNVIVPIVTRGRFGNLKTDIDPDFDLAGMAFEAGLRGLLKNAAKDTGLPINDIFDGIFKKKKKK